MPPRLLAVAVLGLTLTGCGTIQMATVERDRAAKRFETNPDKANIYVYRNESMGGGVNLMLVMDGVPVGGTWAQTYYVVPVATGEHTLISKGENDSILNFNAEAGRNYFVWQEVKMGVFSARSALAVVDEITGQAGVKECKLAETAWVAPKTAPRPPTKAASQPGPAPTSGGCTKDTECKGERICERGNCVDPKASLPRS